MSKPPISDEIRSFVQEEIERLAALGTIPQNRVQYLKDAARDLRGHFDAMGQAEKELGILDQAQFIPGYEPHYAPTTDASATEYLAFMQEAGIKVTPDSPGGQNAIPGGRSPCALRNRTKPHEQGMAAVGNTSCTVKR